MHPLTPPPIGTLWPEQGGTYAGLARGANGQPDHHLILAAEAPEERLAWQPAMAWAQDLRSFGFADWTLPTRSESALLFANLRDQFQPAWHWTADVYEGNGSFAWDQYFDIGYQGNNRKSYEGRARAVRRFAAQSFDPS